MKFNENIVELAALDWLSELGYSVVFGGEIAPGEAAAERANYGEVLLLGRLRAALDRINAHIPPAARAGAVDEAIRRISRTESQNPLVNNHAFHRLLTEGVDVAYRDGGQLKHDKIWLVDFADPRANDWLAVNQFTITDVNLTSRAQTNRRPDVLLFVNGLPLALFELKNAADEHATIHDAFNQLQTYLHDIPSLFSYNALLVVADGVEARLGTLTGGWEWFKPWRTVDGAVIDPPGQTQLETLIKGVFAPDRLLDLIRSFVVFETDGAAITQEGRRLSPVPRRQQGGRSHRRGDADRGRPPRRGDLAHAGQRQEPVDAVLRR